MPAHRYRRKLLSGLESSVTYDDAIHERLKGERDAVLRCVAAEANTKQTGVKIENVAKCVPAATDPARGLPKRQMFWDAVAAGQAPAHNESEARYAGQTVRRIGIDGLVWTDPDVLLHNKWLYDEGHHQTVAAVHNLLREAEGLLELPVDTIPDKTFMPPDGDKKSYVSLSTYCWPSNPEDLENPQGPWECRDGEPFPGRNKIAPDFEKLARVQRNSFNLALAWYFSQDKRFARHAAIILRAFFLDPQTAMNPHLRFAQLSPGTGNAAGEPYGTIDNKAMAMVFDAVAILSESTWWMPEDATRMSRWASEYVLHLQSAHCRNEMSQQNNHGTLFDVQYTAFLKFLGRDEALVDYIETAVKPRLRGQIYGSIMPQEMARPISYAYHSFILEAFVRLAMQADRLLLDLWSYGAESGNSMLDAWDWMVQHWCDRGERLWPQEQLPGAKLDIDRPVIFAGAVYAHAAARASVRTAYTQRSRFYALAWHTFRAGPDAYNEIKWNFGFWVRRSREDAMQSVTRQLSLVKFDDCFITTCPERRVLPEHPPTYPAFCLPEPQSPMPYLDAFRGRWPDAGNATADIKPAVAKGDAQPAVAPPIIPPRPAPEASPAPAAASPAAAARQAAADLTSGTPVDEDAVDNEEPHRSTPSAGDVGVERGDDEGGSGDDTDDTDDTDETDETDEAEGGQLGAHEGMQEVVEEADRAPELENAGRRAAQPTAAIASVGEGDGGARAAPLAQQPKWPEWLLQPSMPSVFAAVLAVLLLLVCFVRHRAQHRFRKRA